MVRISGWKLVIGNKGFTSRWNVKSDPIRDIEKIYAILEEKDDVIKALRANKLKVVEKKFIDFCDAVPMIPGDFNKILSDGGSIDLERQTMYDGELLLFYQLFPLLNSMMEETLAEFKPKLDALRKSINLLNDKFGTLLVFHKF